MREIVTLAAGQCGNQMSHEFWKMAAGEHGLGKDGNYCGKNDIELEKIGVFFTETQDSIKYVPRSINFDLEPGVINKIANTKEGWDLYSSLNLMFSNAGAGNNWAKGHYTEGANMIDEVMDRTRKLAEDCDLMQGFILNHSLGGGTGSGMGTLLVSRIREEFPDKIMATYSVYPSPKVSDVIVEPYNCMLSVHQLIENVDEVFVLDNEALYDICLNVLKSDTSFKVLNSLVARSMCGVTASLRFPGSLNGDLRKMGVNLIPFPRLHFFIISNAPMYPVGMDRYQNIQVQELYNQCFDPHHSMAAVNALDGKYLATSVVFRGDMALKDIDLCTVRMQQSEQQFFVPWIPNNLKSTHCRVPWGDQPKSATFVGNSTALSGIYIRVRDQFNKLFGRRAYIQWYTGEGMDEAEFTEAEANVNDLIDEYEQYQHAEIEDDQQE